MKAAAMTHLTTHTNATAFLRNSQAWLEQEEATNSLILGLALRLVEEPQAWSNDLYLATVSDASRPSLAALMTPPYNLILAGEPEAAVAIELLADDLIQKRWSVAGMMGPNRLVESFVSFWQRRKAGKARQGSSQRLYRLEEVIDPAYSPGRLRWAEEADAELVLQWMEGFREEATPEGPRLSPATAHGRIAERSVFLWEDNGPACMAVKTRPTRHGVSVSWVYTPPERRRRGYASSCVASLSRQLLNAGFEYCTLFTNLNNPTSNHIYQQIGYRPLCDFLEVRFDSRAIDLVRRA